MTSGLFLNQIYIKIFDETTRIEGPSQIADITKDSTKRDVRQAESLTLVNELQMNIETNITSTQ